MKIVDYEIKYKKELLKLFNDFHNDIVKTINDGILKPFKDSQSVLDYVDKTINDSKTKNGFVYLAIVDDKVVGFTQGIIRDHSSDDRYHLVGNPGCEGWIDELYVDKSYRKQGIGKALFNKVKKHFEINNCRAVRLFVYNHNKTARDLYKSMGMKPRNIEMDLKL